MWVKIGVIPASARYAASLIKMKSFVFVTGSHSDYFPAVSIHLVTQIF